MHSLLHFFAALASGFLGIGFILTPLLEGPLNSWDPFVALRLAVARKAAQRIPLRSSVEDLLLDIESSRKFGLGMSPRGGSAAFERPAAPAISAVD
jgi:hypothetical protein